MFEYTDAMVAELRAAGPLDNDSATAFAEKFGFSVHSVRAKAVRDAEIGYTKKPKTSKDGTPVESKADIVQAIAQLTGVDAERLESLGNATKDNLQIVRDALSSD
jgi:hypothetical protein